jgi:hypothetical protein
MNRKEYWVTNICNRNVSLSDLNLTIKAFTSVNLLDFKHYSYTLDELEKSRKTGSIFKKRDKIKVREVAPEIIKMDMSYIRDAKIPTRQRSIYEINEKKYEELDFLEHQGNQFTEDERFAEENAELADLDTKLLVIKGTN